MYFKVLQVSQLKKLSSQMFQLLIKVYYELQRYV